MSDTADEREPVKIPDQFSLKEQLEELQVIYISRRDFIEKRLASGKAVAPSKQLAYYGLARLKAAGETLRRLCDEAGDNAGAAPPTSAPATKARPEPELTPEQKPEPEPSGPPPGMGWDD